MKIFLDTAHLVDIQKWHKTGLIDGVTTNPSLLSKETGSDPKKLLLELCALMKEGEVSIEVTESAPADVYRQAQEIARLADNVIVKIPCHEKYFSVINQLVQEGIKLNITLVFTLLQGLMMSKLGVRYISPFIGRLDDLDIEGVVLIEQLRGMVDGYGFETQILAASIRHVRHFDSVIQAGAHVATVPVAVLEKAAHHPLTDLGMEQFNADWKKRGIMQFP